jgi:hypothetical protein
LLSTSFKDILAIDKTDEQTPQVICNLKQAQWEKVNILILIRSK